MTTDPTTDYTQVEVFPTDTIEDVARRLAAAAPASAVYDGVEVRAEAGQDADGIACEYLRFRREADLRARLGGAAISQVELVAAESPGPGGKIDPWREVRDPQVGRLYVLWERRPDLSVGNVAVVLGVRSDQPTGIGQVVVKRPGAPCHAGAPAGVALHLQHGPVVAAFGSLLVEHAHRCAASEVRIAALEARLGALAELLARPAAEA
jgi:hypothetical protein